VSPITLPRRAYRPRSHGLTRCPSCSDSSVACEHARTLVNTLRNDSNSSNLPAIEGIRRSVSMYRVTDFRAPSPGKPKTTLPPDLLRSGCQRLSVLLELRHHVSDAEARRFLPRWEFLQRLHPLQKSGSAVRTLLAASPIIWILRITASCVRVS